MKNNVQSAGPSGRRATLQLEEDDARWLSDHLEEWIAGHTVNTEPVAGAIVRLLHDEGF